MSGFTEAELLDELRRVGLVGAAKLPDGAFTIAEINALPECRAMSRNAIQLKVRGLFAAGLIECVGRKEAIDMSGRRTMVPAYAFKSNSRAQ